MNFSRIELTTIKFFRAMKNAKRFDIAQKIKEVKVEEKQVKSDFPKALRSLDLVLLHCNEDFHCMYKICPVSSFNCCLISSYVVIEVMQQMSSTFL